MPQELLFDLIGNNPYIPNHILPYPKQLKFLELECLDALFGGAASGGKSTTLLTAALMFAEVPGYAALIVRRNFTDLKLPGGLIDKALEWLGKNKLCKWNAQENRWRFRSGATLQFGYADKEGDERRYHGSEFQLVCIDEAVQFTEVQLKFFFERLRRRRDIPVPLRMRLATTPGGVSHEYLKKRYVDAPPSVDRAFIPATMLDNPSIDAEQYVRSLMELNPLRRAQILNGDWNAIEGGRFKREWFGTWAARSERMVLREYSGREVEVFDPSSCARFQTCDPAASASKDADDFVLSTWLVSPKANVVWWGCHVGHHEITEQVHTCQRLYRRYQPQFLGVEEVLNQRALAQLLRQSANPLMVVRSVTPRGQNKADHAAGFISLASSGRVFLPDAPSHDFPLETVTTQLLCFSGEPKKKEKDDIVDSGSYMADLLPLVRPIPPGGAHSRPPMWYTNPGGPLSGLR